MKTAVSLIALSYLFIFIQEGNQILLSGIFSCYLEKKWGLFHPV